VLSDGDTSSKLPDYFRTSRREGLTPRVAHSSFWGGRGSHFLEVEKDAEKKGKESRHHLRRGAAVAAKGVKGCNFGRIWVLILVRPKKTLEEGDFSQGKEGKKRCLRWKRGDSWALSYRGRVAKGSRKKRRKFVARDTARRRRSLGLRIRGWDKLEGTWGNARRCACRSLTTIPIA